MTIVEQSLPTANIINGRDLRLAVTIDQFRQYYVHRMLNYRRRQSSDNIPSIKPPKRFKKRGSKSFIVHEYNFLKEIASEIPRTRFGRSPYTESNAQLQKTKTSSFSSSKKYAHYKKTSLCDEVSMAKKQIADLSRQESKNIDVQLYQLPNMTVSALNMACPRDKYEKSFKLIATKCPYEMSEGINNSKKIMSLVKKLHRAKGPSLMGLDVRKFGSEKQKIDKLKQTSVMLSSNKIEDIPKSNAFSQQIIKPKRKPAELRTIGNMSEDTIETIFEEKARNYRQLLFYVYLGCGYYREIEPCSQKYQRKMDIKYQYYIGKGNNCNLIRSIMKKRWWWTPSNEITPQTKFVWTQRKVNSFIETQPVFEQCPPQTKVQSTDKLFKIENETELSRLLHQQDIQIYKAYTKPLRKQPHSISTRMKLLKKRPICELRDGQPVHNHFEYNQFIGNKKALLKNMTNYYTFSNATLQQWNIPQTFHVSSPQDKEFKRFIGIFREKQNANSKTNIWIIKPGENSNRGQGIQVSKNLKEISSLLQSKLHTYVIQQYKTDLFLYNRRKFDIRTYCLITRIGGVMKAYWYQEGYIRTSSQLYQLDDLTDPMIHLTNDAIQKNGENYGKYEPGNKISYQELQKYLDANHPQSHLTVQKLVEDMKSTAQQAIKACYFKLDPNCRNYNFQIFGLDFLIDGSFKPWLLEVNTNPCLELNSPLLARLIPQMVENAFKLGLDPIYPPTACPYNSKPYLSDNAIERNRFELIFDSQYDRLLQYETDYMQDSCKYEDDDELYQNQGQILIVND